MTRWLAALAISAACATAGPAHAAQRLQVCAREGNGSQAYRVQATYLTGSELVQATSSFAYDAFSSYVVIFWAPGQASIIKLDYPTLSAIPMQGTDQQGRRWEVSAGGLCY